MPHAVMKHVTDPRQLIQNEIGDISDFEVFNNQILVAVYLRPEKTSGGIILTDNNRDEDKYQGKVGLILKMGPSAFQDDSGRWFQDAEVSVGDWIVFRASESWSLSVNKVLCRMLDDTAVRGKISSPDRVW